MSLRRVVRAQTQTDAFIDHRILSAAKWEFTPEGKHIEPGIPEMNL
ncbi:hypothetical protein [Pseudotabrizicola sp. 4114]|nr:hypothetical protein [Pseudorhodobacter sp. 4114]